MKIIWLSVAPWAPTGYGQQTSIFTPRIRDAGHDVAISAQNGLQFAEMDWDGIRVYPADYTRLNKRMLKHHVRDFAGDDPVQVISLFDIWPWIDASPSYGGCVADFDGLEIAAWLPIDCEPVAPKTLAALDAFRVRPIAMSRFGERVLVDAGYDPLYVPHGIETDVYRPYEQAEARAAVGIPADKFVIGMVANNSGVAPPRKAFPQVLQAFSIFRERHDDAFLYLHTEVTGEADAGLNLLALSSVFGIPADAIDCVSQPRYLAGKVKSAEMARVYSAFDVLANPSYGEGFGLPIVEAQACGTPVIVTAFTSMPELCGAGWLVGGEPMYQPSFGAMWMPPSPEEILAAFEAAYEARGDQARRDAAREFAVQYDADRVMVDHWAPALEQLGAPREVAPLVVPVNRAHRRALAKAGR